MLISVVVPVYRDNVSLSNCLLSLKNQTLCTIFYEVIVVNNDPYGQVDSAIKKHFGCEIVDERKPGSYAARNAGARAAQGDVYAFIDVDCSADVMWLEKIYRFFEENSSNFLLAGNVSMIKEKNFFNYAEAYDYLVGINQQRYVRNGVAATANLSITAKDFKRLGGFDDSHFSGGDTDFAIRAVSSGMKLFYGEDVIVYHPLRAGILDLYNKDRRVVGGKLGRSRFVVGLRCLLPPLVRMQLILTERDVGGLVRWKAMVVLALLWIGRIAEAFRIIILRKKACKT